MWLSFFVVFFCLDGARADLRAVDIVEMKGRALQVLQGTQTRCLGRDWTEGCPIVVFMKNAVEQHWPSLAEIELLTAEKRRERRGLFTERGHVHRYRVAGLYLASTDKIEIDPSLTPDDALFVMIHEVFHRAWQKSELRRVFTSWSLKDWLHMGDAAYSVNNQGATRESFREQLLVAPSLLNETLAVLSTYAFYEILRDKGLVGDFARQAPLTHTWTRKIGSVIWTNSGVIDIGRLVQRNYAREFNRSYVTGACVHVGPSDSGFGLFTKILSQCGVDDWFYRSANKLRRTSSWILLEKLTGRRDSSLSASTDPGALKDLPSFKDGVWSRSIGELGLYVPAGNEDEIYRDLQPSVLAQIKRILRKHLPQARVLDGGGGGGGEGVHPDFDWTLFGSSYPLLENGAGK